jgi:OmpA-OmpF porin, OOP family
MRSALGVGVLVFGWVVLALWGRAAHAPRMESNVTAGVQAAISGNDNDALVQVAGRDITLRGLAASAEERAALIALAEGVRGRRVVNADALGVIPTAAPYTTSIVKAVDGSLGASGYAPSAGARRRLGAVLGGAEGTLSLAAGADGAWHDLVESGTLALASLNSGQAAITDDRLHVTGEATGPEQRDAMLAALAGVPQDRVTHDIVLLDDGTPQAFVLDWVAGATASLRGKLPVGVDAPGLAAALGLDALDDAGVVQGLIGAPASYELPARIAPLMVDLSSLTLDYRDGTTRLRVAALVDDPAARDALMAALQGVGADDLDARIDMRDDGTPASYRFDWDAGSGGALSGKLPRGITPASVSAVLGLDDIGADGVSTAPGGEMGDAALWTRLRAVLPMVETLTLQAGPSDQSIVAGLPRGVDLTAAQATLGDALGASVTVETAQAEVADGTERTHALTGARERLSGGYWLPIPDFTPDLSSCEMAANAALDDAQVQFESGSANLDADALRILNILGSILRECTTTGGLRAEIGGHTDSSGNDDSNRRLSQLRASAVRLALIERGADRERLVSRGYGSSRPVADNETAEGRAQNRRTTITWFE